MNSKPSHLLWLAIRVLGLFFLAKALMAIPAIPTNWMNMNAATRQVQMADTDEGENTVLSEAKEATTTLFVASVVEFFFFGAVALYLCRRGRLFYRFIQLPLNQNDEEPGGE